jgi:hypothetical protein
METAIGSKGECRFMKNDITRDIHPTSWNMIAFVTFVITAITEEYTFFGTKIKFILII